MEGEKFGNRGNLRLISKPRPNSSHHMMAGDDDDQGSMLSSTTTMSSSTSPTGNGTFMGKYSTEVFQDRAMDVSTVPSTVQYSSTVQCSVRENGLHCTLHATHSTPLLES